MRARTSATWAFLALCGAACASAEARPHTTTLTSGTIPSMAPFPEQVEAGQHLFAEHCAKCHGASGEGNLRKNAPRLVGVAQGEALPLEPAAASKVRKSEFRTAADVERFVREHMPADAPGSLTEDQYWALVAFTLKENGIDLGKEHLDSTLGSGVLLHP
jgi:cytochrome c